MHPAIEQKLKHFEYGHLPVHLQEISKGFYDLAHRLVGDLGLGLDGPEATAALRKLCEAKDCAVRAGIERQNA